MRSVSSVGISFTRRVTLSAFSGRVLVISKPGSQQMSDQSLTLVEKKGWLKTNAVKGLVNRTERPLSELPNIGAGDRKGHTLPLVG